MKSVLSKIIGAIVLLVVGVFLGRSFFASPKEDTVPMPSTLKYRNVGLSNNTTQVAQNKDFVGQIIEVKNGSSIQEAVKVANAGDLIRVYPGTYSENVYIDKDDISLQGIVYLLILFRSILFCRKCRGRFQDCVGVRF